MAEIVKEIVARLKLDSKDFKGGLSDTQKDLVKISAGIATFTAAVGFVTKITADYQSEILKMAHATGSTAEGFSVMAHAAELSGLSTETLANSMKKLLKPSEEAKNALYQMGVSTRDANGDMKNQSVLLDDVAEGLKNLKSPQEQAKAAMMLFGDEGTKMVAMLKDGKEGMKKFREEAEAMGLVVSESAGENAEKFNKDIEKLGMSIKGLTVSIGESVIAFANQGGLLENFRSAIQSVTLWWRNLDQGTKNIIFSIGESIIAVGGLIAALGIIITIAPLVKSAFMTMLGPVGLILTAITAMVVGLVQNWTNAKEKIMPIVEVLQKSIGKFIDSINFSGISKGITDSTQEVSTFGTVAVFVFKVLASAVLGVIGVLQTFVDMFKNVHALIDAYREDFEGLSGIDYFAAVKKNNEQIAALWEKLGHDVVSDAKTMMDDIGKVLDTDSTVMAMRSQMEKLKKEADKGGKDIRNLIALNTIEINPVFTSLQRATEDAEKVDAYWDAQIMAATKKKDEVLKMIGGEMEANKIQFEIDFMGVEKFEDRIKSVMKVIGALGDEGQKVTKFFSDMANVTAEQMARAQAVMERDFEVQMGRMQKAHQQTMDMLKEQYKAEEDALAKSYDDQIALIDEKENQKTAILEKAINDRSLAMNQEYQNAVALENARYQAFIDSETARFEAEKAFELAKAVDKEQRNLAETEYDNDFKKYMENQAAMHDQTLSDLAKNFNDKARADEASARAAAKADAAADAEARKQLEKDKNIALEDAQKAHDKSLNDLAAQQKKEEDDLRKKQIDASWRAQVDQYNATKSTKIAEAITAGISSAAQGFAALASIPIIGIPLGLALAGAIMSSTYDRVQMIRNNEPIKPAALFLREGGIIGGSISHEQGGVPATLESGEAVISAARTEKLMSAVDGIGGGIVINIMPGAISTSDNLLSERMIEQFSTLVAQRIARYGGR